ncbi:MAG TPA: hypothetical protein PKX48_11720 [Planctomycetota bacterium]|jgi:uncharacterized membrane protein YebE (DUF533 family)|nr:hypothetical protein [Planctomycetota bacterium]OQC22257.1 MAG: hypothetical protein BWX69_00108 [Planctomycetes bacterium ADurb.Bin069]NMD35355.1 hypothetical protein [Planctomycetota bacterium]HNS00140.1 hypothetical protein [Planctomycetota bacterium]HNU25908.1 hypothetical protein [Planctomycetota bacterium]
MESLKKNGFLVGVIAMLAAIGAFAYFVTWSWGISKYHSLQREISKNESVLAGYAKRKPEDLPTKRKLEADTDLQETLRKILADVERFYAERAEKLARLQLVKGGETFTAHEDAAFGSAFNTALDDLNRKYSDVRAEYVKRVYPAHAAAAPEASQSKISLSPTISSNEADLIAAAQMCRITTALVTAATEAGWGGLTSVVFEKKKGTRAAEEKPKASAPAGSKPPPPARTGRRGAAAPKTPEAAVVPEYDARDLYERVRLTAAGEIRFEDLGSFLHALELRAADADDPVFFVVEECVLAKQKDRLLKASYKAEEPFPRLDDAKRAPLDFELKLPTATMRLTLSVLKYKGFAQ